jgi:hypothetical protein
LLVSLTPHLIALSTTTISKLVADVYLHRYYTTTPPLAIVQQTLQ